MSNVVYDLNLYLVFRRVLCCQRMKRKRRKLRLTRRSLVDCARYVSQALRDTSTIVSIGMAFFW